MFGVQDILLMVGPYGNWIKHNLESKTVLVSEGDGIRLISAEQHELLSRVPDSLTDIFKIGSTAPGQHLCVCACWAKNPLDQIAETRKACGFLLCNLEICNISPDPTGCTAPLLVEKWHTYQIHNKHMSIDLHQLLIVLTMQAGTLVVTSPSSTLAGHA